MTQSELQLTANERFDALQARLAPQFAAFLQDPSQPYTAVVVSAHSLDRTELAKIEGIEHYEERGLFNLMLLRHPRMRVIYVTSKRLNPLVVDYYLHQMRDVTPAHARQRLTLLDCDDSSPRSLTEKVLERPRLVARIRAAIHDTRRAHLNVFNSTELERDLALALGIPVYATSPELAHLGSKTGSRWAFREAGVPFVPGREDLRDRTDLVEGLADLWLERPELSRVVVKLNEGFSGEGNAILDLKSFRAPLGESPAQDQVKMHIRKGLSQLQMEAPDLSVDEYLEQFDRMGGVCEAWIEGADKRSPSVQLRVTPLREVVPLSTHDQVLGGPNGQVFLGATFPAEHAYRLRIQDYGRQVGDVLCRQGVIGRFGVDFLVLPQPNGEPIIYAVEVNLREGGTTHPFKMLKLVTGGEYEERTGEFLTAQGQPRCYFATDALKDPRYRGLLPYDLLDELVVRNLHFRVNETGVLFHLLGCLSEFGKLGCVCVASTVEESCGTYRQVVSMLDDLADSQEKDRT